MTKLYCCVIIFILNIFFTVTVYSQSPVVSLAWTKQVFANGSAVAPYPVELAFTPDASKLVAAGSSGALNGTYVWQSATGQQYSAKVDVSKTKGETASLAISKNNQTIVTGYGNWYCEEDCLASKAFITKQTTNGKLTSERPTNTRRADAIAYSPDNSVIAVAYYYGNFNEAGRIEICDTNLAVKYYFSANNYIGLIDVKFTPDGKYLLATGFDGYIRVWNYKTSTLVRQWFVGDYNEAGDPLSLSISPDSKFVVSGSFYNLPKARIWRIEDGALVDSIDPRIEDGSIIAVYSPDGKYIITGTHDYNNIKHTVSVYAAAGAHLVKQETKSSGVDAVAVSNITNSNYYVAAVNGSNLDVYKVTNRANLNNSIARKDVSAVTITPNASNGNFTINMQLSGGKKQTTLTLYNNTGNKIWQQNAGLISGAVSKTVYLANRLNNGVYTLTVQKGKEVLSQKVIISK